MKEAELVREAELMSVAAAAPPAGVFDSPFAVDGGAVAVDGALDSLWAAGSAAALPPVEAWLGEWLDQHAPGQVAGMAM